MLEFDSRPWRRKRLTRRARSAASRIHRRAGTIVPRCGKSCCSTCILGTALVPMSQFEDSQNLKNRANQFSRAVPDSQTSGTSSPKLFDYPCDHIFQCFGKLTMNNYELLMSRAASRFTDLELELKHVTFDAENRKTRGIHRKPILRNHAAASEVNAVRCQ